jgi:hypothetical protein
MSFRELHKLKIAARKRDLALIRRGKLKAADVTLALNVPRELLHAKLGLDKIKIPPQHPYK